MDHEDARQLDQLTLEGLPLGEERWLTHFFSFPLNREGAFAAEQELVDSGWADVILDEELTGDDYWHIAALRRQPVSAESITATRVELEGLAARHGGKYDGWDLTWRERGRPLPRDRPEWIPPTRN